MGNWNISIRGVGAHHNSNYLKDADRMARRFVRELRAAGHKVVSAEITHGGAEQLCEPAGVNEGLIFRPEKLDDEGRDAAGVLPGATPGIGQVG